MTKIPRREVSKSSIERANDRHKSAIRHMRKRLAEVDGDPHRAKRLAKQECVMCFGCGRIGGASCTFSECAFCGERLTSPNTCIDVLCQKCAAIAQLCKLCGADIDLKNRRSRALPEVQDGTSSS